MSPAVQAARCYAAVMMDQPTAMHVARIKSSHTDKQGREREYESRLLRRTYRDGGKVRHETLANLSKMPDRVVDAVEAALKGEVLVPAGEAAVTVARSLPHGHVAAVHAMARKLGLPGAARPGRPAARPGPGADHLPGRAPRARSCPRSPGGATRRSAPTSASRTRRPTRPTRRWTGCRPGRTRIETQARPPAPRPGREPVADGPVRPVVLLAGGDALPARGARLLPRRQEGQRPDRVRAAHRPRRPPVAVRVFEGNTADPAAFTEIAGVVKDTFGLKKMVMVGDRGMITTARIEALRELDGKYAWITALRAPAIRKLMADDGPLQLSLFDEQDLAEITSDDFPGERLIACRNPALADERARKREDLLAATEKLLAPIIARVAAGRLAGAAEIGKKAGEVIDKYKMAKHFDVTITDDSLAVERKQDQIDDEARLDGIYVIRTPVPQPRPRRRRHRHRLQEPQVRRARLPPHQIRRPRPAPGLPPPRKTRQGPRADLHARRLPHLAPAPGLGTADLHRRGTPRSRRTPSPPRSARHPPRPRPPASTTSTAAPTAASRACSPTSAPSPATSSASPAPPPPSPSSPSPPASRQPGLRPHRSRHPAHPAQVARNRRQARRESAGQRRSRHPNDP